MWSYNTSKKEEMNYFPSYDDVQFAILCVMRYSAPQNDIPDYYVYEDGHLFETVYGKDLFKFYVDNGGYVFKDCLNKEIEENIEEKNDEQVEADELSETINRVNNSLENLINNINRLTNMLGGDVNER